jgi:putative DNA primase/helicase
MTSTLVSALRGWRQQLYRAFGFNSSLPRGQYVGRWRTHDAAMSRQSLAGANGKPSIAEQERAWLERSCLTAEDLPGVVIPKENARTIEFFDIDGQRIPEAAIRRRFRPTGGFGALTEAADVEPDPKYLHPSGVRPHLYYPQNAENHWRQWSQDSKERKIFAEGCAKAACGNKFGHPAVGIQGCWGWRSVQHGLLMLPEFNDYNLEDCDVYWIPDHDRKPKSVADVLRASSAFALLLKERGARVHVVWLRLLEGFDKVGLDDFLYHYSRGGKDKSAAKRALEDLLAETPVWQDFEITDPGNARRWVSMYGPRFRYVGPRRGWLVYRDGCWRDDAELQQLETTKQMFDGMLEDARNMGNAERFGLLRKHATAPRIENVARLAKSDPAVIITPAKLDQHPLLVNCQNGTLEMPSDRQGTVRLRPHCPDDLLTRAVSVAWSPDAKCPHFLAALNFWTKKDTELQRTIQQLLGLSCTGVTREQLFVILYGPGATGKSTLIEIIREILADYAVTLSSDTFLLRRFGKAEERKLAPLPGARFASSSETERGGVMDENLIKLLTGEDTVTGRQLYEEQFNFTPQAKIWLRTNNPPEIRGMGNDIWRRVVALPFGQVISPERRDRTLKEKLRAEAEGIFAWMIRGYSDYVKHGLVLASTVSKAVEAYRKDQDVLGRFFEEQCEFGPDYSSGREELYRAFCLWCETARVRTALNNKQFKTEILARFSDRIKEKQMYLKDSKKQERRWKGVATKTALFMNKQREQRAKAAQPTGTD